MNVSIQQENLLVKYGGIDFASIDDKFYESKVLSFQHPKFSVQNQQYDIALLKLLSPVSYQFNVLPICLPDKEMAFEYDQSIVAGWGKLSESMFINKMSFSYCTAYYFKIAFYYDRGHCSNKTSICWYTNY